jgi:hypothetical protein
MTPGWILDVFAALMLTVAAVSAARLAVARPWRHGSVVADTDVAHLLMAIAMAGMLVPSLSTLPSAAWEVIFGVLTAWFGYRVIRDARTNGARALAGGHCAPHLVHSAAMLYMFLALVPAAGAGQGMSGMGGSSGSGMQSLDLPTLGFVFALILAGYTIWDLDQLSSRTRGLTAPGFARPAPALAPAPAGAPATASRTDPARATFPAPAASRAPAARDAAPAGRGAAPAGRDAAPAGRGAARGTLLSPRMTVACRIAMGATMAFMLLIMI